MMTLNLNPFPRWVSSTFSGDSGSYAGRIVNGRAEIDAVATFVPTQCDTSHPAGYEEVYTNLYWILNCVQKLS